MFHGWLVMTLLSFNESGMVLFWWGAQFSRIHIFLTNSFHFFSITRFRRKSTTSGDIKCITQNKRHIFLWHQIVLISEYWPRVFVIYIPFGPPQFDRVYNRSQELWMLSGATIYWGILAQDSWEVFGVINVSSGDLEGVMSKLKSQ